MAKVAARPVLRGARGPHQAVVLALGAGLFLLGFLVLAPLEAKVRSFQEVPHQIQKIRLLPSGKILRPLSLGFSTLVADGIWLQVIQVVGAKTVTPQDYQWVYHALDVVTDLDPRFAYAYEFGGIVLSVLAHQPERAAALLRKGLAPVPDSWRIPFYLGFTEFFYLKDYRSAALHMSLAAQRPGHPAYVPRLAARLWVAAGEPETALQFLQRMIQSTESPEVREALRKRMEAIRSGQLTQKEALPHEGP